MTESDRRNFLILAAGSAFTVLTTGFANAGSRSIIDDLANLGQGPGKKEKTPESKPAPAPPKTDNKSGEFAAGEQTDGSYVLDPANPPKIDIKTKEDANGTFVKVGNDTVLVSKSKDNKTYYAVSGLCTHKACAVSWKADDNCFRCPCHGSKFSTDGKVTKKPATDDLTSFSVKEVKGKGGKKFLRIAKK
ncbi:MAG: ubiquinol-cytochrome c reductase iron-sulfur subunit [Planctomycetota bacterium]